MKEYYCIINHKNGETFVEASERFWCLEEADKYFRDKWYFGGYVVEPYKK